MSLEPNQPRPEVPRAVISRLSLYLRELQQLVKMGHETISSIQLGKRLGITDAQVRKDLAYFGQFGQPGKGYGCVDLIVRIREILGTNRTWPVALVGCGNLGQALLGYQGFSRQGFKVIAAFDTDSRLIGSQIGELTIQSFEDFSSVAARNAIRLVILAVPASAAIQAVEWIVKAGVTGILNFAPVTLTVPKNVSVIDVDMAMELEQLAFAVVKQDRVS
jgi:redox-sensing transcriptional repressor